MVVIASDNFLLKNICIIIYKPMNIIGLFVYSYTRKAHYTGALILMGDLQLCKKSCRNRAWLGVNRCVFVAGKRQYVSIYCPSCCLNDNNFYILGKITDNSKIDTLTGDNFGQKIDIEERHLQNYQTFYNKYINIEITGGVINYSSIMLIGGGWYCDINSNYYSLVAFDYQFGVFASGGSGKKYTRVYTLDDTNRTYKISEIAWGEDYLIYYIDNSFN